MVSLSPPQLRVWGKSREWTELKAMCEVRVPGKNSPSHGASSNWIRLGSAEDGWNWFYNSDCLLCPIQGSHNATNNHAKRVLHFDNILQDPYASKGSSNSKHGWSPNSNKTSFLETGFKEQKKTVVTNWSWHMKRHCLTSMGISYSHEGRNLVVHYYNSHF